MKLLIKEIDLGFLSAHYEHIEFRMFRSDDPLSFISCITCVCETSEDVVKNWRAIQNIVAVYYQPSSSLAAWNVYLAFVTVDKVPVWEKYEIENNKFTARKIVLDGLSEIPSIDQLAIELQKELLGSDLTLDSQVNESEGTLLYFGEHVRGAPLDSTSESREKRALMINNIIELLNQNEN
ncbi:ABC-three component system middle component 1 [Photobacterium phosphoreum]|uniref:ABC-three component system middle component 1 n=1 Tax=Photobacterium phosphoreum TaxID=659 RepID=UPI0024B7F28D|nr:ABC-three component system middle component 1 [Photobacterium phosphoreum]